MAWFSFLKIMKYYLLIHGDVTNENTLMCFDTPAERDEETILRIFGDDITTQDEAEQWDKMRTRLDDKGALNFEGDPGLEWFTATPADKLNTPNLPTSEKSGK
jgi:hypothetical protein